MQRRIEAAERERQNNAFISGRFSERVIPLESVSYAAQLMRLLWATLHTFALITKRDQSAAAKFTLSAFWAAIPNFSAVKWSTRVSIYSWKHFHSRLQSTRTHIWAENFC